MKTSITKEEIAQLPIVEYEGRVILIDSVAEIEKSVAYLSTFSRLGIDTETRPAFKKGVRHNVALLQLATHDSCFLFRLNRTGLTPSLTQLLENKKIIKVGLALRDDIKALQRLLPFEPHSIVELQTLAKEHSITDESLQKLYALLYEKKISKAQRVTNWEASVLASQQLTYAAIDAWACLMIYDKLMDLKNNTTHE